MKEFTLKSMSQGKLRVEDRCAALHLADSCSDMSMVVREIYRMAGR